MLAMLGLTVIACASSVRVLQPPKAGQGLTANPVAFAVQFHPRADQSTFSAQLDGQDITSTFTTSGNGAAATSPNPNLTAGDHTLRVRADMRPSRAFDVLGFDWHFTIAPNPAVPQPSFSLTSVSPSAQTITWGQTATYTATVDGRNGFVGAVALEVQNPPAGVGMTFSPASLTLSAAAQQQSSTLSAATNVAASPRSAALRVRAAGANRLPGNRTVTLRILPSPGAFTEVTPRSTNSACGSVTAIVVGAGPGAGVRFLSPNGNTQAIAFSSGYAISPHCRAGLVVAPVVNGVSGVVVRNLGFLAGSGATPIPGQSLGMTSASSAFTNFYFSPDDSLMIVIASGGPAHPGAASATLHDLLTGSAVGGSLFITGVITNITLTGDRVDITGATPTNAPFSVGWTLP
jgi:hypothetical protein